MLYFGDVNTTYVCHHLIPVNSVCLTIIFTDQCLRLPNAVGDNIQINYASSNDHFQTFINSRLCPKIVKCTDIYYYSVTALVCLFFGKVGFVYCEEIVLVVRKRCLQRKHEPLSPGDLNKSLFIASNQIITQHFVLKVIRAKHKCTIFCLYQFKSSSAL